MTSIALTRPSVGRDLRPAAARRAARARAPPENELEAAEYAERRRDPLDRRRHLVHLTAKGRRALDRAERAQEAVEDEVLSALEPDERARLRELLARALDKAGPAAR